MSGEQETRSTTIDRKTQFDRKDGRGDVRGEQETRSTAIDRKAHLDRKAVLDRKTHLDRAGLREW